MRSSFAALATLAGVASAGMSTVAHTDAKTSIDFQQFTDSDSGFQFGVALPKTPGKDFIGQIVAPGTGWGGVSLTSSMMASVLIAAWPNGDDVVGTIRKTNSYVNPSVDSSGPSLYPIEKGTFVNSTHYSYTFLCKNCITGDSDSFKTSTATAVLGWALSDTAPSTPSSVSSVLKYHSTGFGEFGLKVADAESANYATWAKMASATSASSGGSNSTSTTNGTTTSTPVSTPLASPITLNTTYDYIVVGGGDSGIVVAERLAETSASVLLIERGGKSQASTGGTDMVSWNNSVTPYDVPAYGYAVEDTADTSYCTDTASTAGCILGGSTSINAEMFVRPQEADFENWPEGWQWSDIQSSAEAFYERNPGTITPSADGKRYFQGTYSILSNLLKGNGWAEVDAIEQPNKKHMVYSHPPFNILNSTRAGPVLTYLPLAQQQKNFKLQLNTKVLRVVRSGSAVSGVEIQLSSGQTEIVPLSKNGKVILAAGALSTPRLLINSGIGPQDQIETVNKGTSGISVNTSDIIELPVGKSLKDHPIFSITVDVSSSNITVFDATEPTKDQISLYAQGSGPLAEGMQRLNFWSSVKGSDGVTRFIQGTCATASASSIKIKVYLTHGLTSEGVLGMAADGSTTFITKPWLTTEADKEAITTFLTEFLAYINKSGSLTIDSTTGGNVTAADLISNYVTGDHFVGTAKMGTDSGLENGTAVVDTNCKVYGTDNLYVVDASIHPDLPTGNTQAIIAVVAEQAAKVISGSAGSSSGSVSSGSASSGSSSSSSGSVSSGSASGSSGSASSGSGSGSGSYGSSGSASASTDSVSSAAANVGGGVYTELVTSTIEGQATVYTTVHPSSATGIESQVAGGQAAPSGYTPVVGGSTPIAGGSTPVAGGSTPVASGIQSAVAGGSSTPVAAGSSPVAAGSSLVASAVTSVVSQVVSASEVAITSVYTISASSAAQGGAAAPSGQAGSGSVVTSVYTSTAPASTQYSTTTIYAVETAVAGGNGGSASGSGFAPAVSGSAPGSQGAQSGSGEAASSAVAGGFGQQTPSVVTSVQSASETVMSSVVTVTAAAGGQGQGQAGGNGGVSVVTSVWTSTIPGATSYVTKTVAAGAQQTGSSSSASSGQGAPAGQGSSGQASSGQGSSGQASSGQGSFGQGSGAGASPAVASVNGNKPKTSIFTVVQTPQTTVSTVYVTQSAAAAQGTSGAAGSGSGSNAGGNGGVQVITQILTSTIPASTSYYTTIFAASATIPAAYTTSTVYATSVRTVTSCAASITNCPARSQSVAVVTDVVAVTTTICPVTAAAGAQQTPGAGTPGTPVGTPYATPYGFSTLQTIVASGSAQAAAVSGALPSAVPTPAGGSSFNLPANWSSIIPSSALNETLSATPTPIDGVATPDGALPQGFTVRDLLEWVTYVIESVWHKKSSSASA
ncbi:hypothetical protein HDK77DRAFT_306444 [Phyllosticta capitalensis]